MTHYRTHHCKAYRAAQWCMDKLEDSWIAVFIFYSAIAALLVAANVWGSK